MVPDFQHAILFHSVTSMYLLYFVELNKWGNNTAMLERNWPAIESAIAWQMSTAATMGLPTNIIDTYDILRQSRYGGRVYGVAPSAYAFHFPSSRPAFPFFGSLLSIYIIIRAPSHSTLLFP